MFFLGEGAEYFWGRFIDFVEIVCEESFWVNLLGERLFVITKRYAGNDTILFYLFLSFIPAISELIKGGYSYLKRLTEEMFYVSVVIGDNELIYTPIDEYLTKNFKGIHELRHVRGKTGYAEPSDNNNRNSYYSYYRHNRSDQDNTPLIELTPGIYHIVWGTCSNF
jgi:hypothetical protein